MARPQNCGKCKKPKRPKGKKFKDLEGYCECGRPPIIDKNTMQKLEDAFMMGLSDVKACAYANISPRTLYYYQADNPEFLQRKEQLKLSPDLLAQKTVVESLNNTQHAWKWLEKKDKDFMPVTKVEHSGSVEVADLTEEMSPEEKEAITKLRTARRKRIEDKSKEME